MRGIDIKQIRLRAFRISGLTAKWGVGDIRPPMPPALRTALVAWYNTEIQKATNLDVIESYAEDFTTSKWDSRDVNAVFTKTAKSLHLTNVLTVSSFLKTKAQTYAPEMVVKVSGLQPGVTVLNYRYGSNADLVQITQDGIYTLPAGIPGAEVDGYNGFRATTAFGECDITIEQLPTSKLTDLSGNGHHLHLYGFTGSDNIVDGMLQHTGTQYGISYGLPILTDYTVCSNRAWIDPGINSVFVSKSYAPGNGAFIFEYVPEGMYSSKAGTYSFGNMTTVPAVSNGFSYQTKDSYNGTPITAGTAGDTDMLLVGGVRPGDPRVYKGSYKSLVLFNRTITTGELAYVKRWMA